MSARHHISERERVDFANTRLVLSFAQDNGSEVREVAPSGIYKPRATVARPSLSAAIARQEVAAAACLSAGNRYGHRALMGHAERLRRCEQRNNCRTAKFA